MLYDVGMIYMRIAFTLLKIIQLFHWSKLSNVFVFVDIYVGSLLRQFSNIEGVSIQHNFSRHGLNFDPL